MTAVRLRRVAVPVAGASGEVAEEDIVVSSRAGRQDGALVPGCKGRGAGAARAAGGEDGRSMPPSCGLRVGSLELAVA
ncbi:hypothetical protein GCM10010421_39040 [Streptomyces glaucus]|uniref:Secreted protein n=1 Tax=Streptomyces glaucus TaxID=284029 RepID=A0ABN3JZV5_9ACTN